MSTNPDRDLPIIPTPRMNDAVGGDALADGTGLGYPPASGQPSSQGTPASHPHYLSGQEQSPRPHYQGHPQSNDGGTMSGFYNTLRRLPARDTNDKILGGVCSGLGREMNFSANTLRIILVVLAVFFGTGVGVYLLAWLLMPTQDGSIALERLLGGSSGGGNITSR